MSHTILLIINMLVIILQAAVESKVNKFQNKPFKYYYTIEFIILSIIAWFIILLTPRLLPI